MKKKCNIRFQSKNKIHVHVYELDTNLQHMQSEISIPFLNEWGYDVKKILLLFGVLFTTNRDTCKF